MNIIAHNRFWKAVWADNFSIPIQSIKSYQLFHMIYPAYFK